MKRDDFHKLDVRILGSVGIVILAWSKTCVSLMFRIARFELGSWDWLNIGLWSLAGPAVSVPSGLYGTAEAGWHGVHTDTFCGCEEEREDKR